MHTVNTLPEPEKPEKFFFHVEKGKSVKGRPIPCIVLGKGREVHMVISGIHGDEKAGGRLVRHLICHLKKHSRKISGKQFVFIPNANPDGLENHGRKNANQVDLNRNFDAANWRQTPQNGPYPLSEPETRFITRMINVYQPDTIISLHGPLGCVDYDGPAHGLANLISDEAGLPIRKLGARPGSLGSYAGLDLNIPVITLELPAKAEMMNTPNLWRKYGPALLQAFMHGSRHFRTVYKKPVFRKTQE